jgi:hypothetical protein
MALENRCGILPADHGREIGATGWACRGQSRVFLLRSIPRGNINNPLFFQTTAEGKTEEKSKHQPLGTSTNEEGEKRSS